MAQTIRLPAALVLTEDRTWIVFAGISLLCHIVLICVIIFLPQFTRPDNTAVSIMDVNLLRPQTVRDTRPAVKKNTSAARPVHSGMTSVKPEKNAVARPKKLKPIASLKRRTYKAKTVAKSAIREMEKKAVTDRPSHLEQALERIRATVNDDRPEKKVIEDNGAYEPDQSTVRQRIVAFYAEDLKYHVEQNWAMPDRFVGNTGLMATVALTVHRDGTIDDIWFKIRSGNRYFDDSVERAVRKSSPAPPFPETIKDPVLNIFIEFAPPG